MRQAMLSPRQLAHIGIAPEPFRTGRNEYKWRCTPCNLGLQNGLTGARAHYDAVHAGTRPQLYVVAS